jgi:3-dehydroquinate synthase
MMAAEFSRRIGWLNNFDVARIKRLFERAGLPTVGPALGAQNYLKLMAHDKKVEAGKLRFVLLRGIGQAVVAGDVGMDDAGAAIEARCRATEASEHE